MVREREKYVARTNERAREMLSKAKSRSEEMVSESHIVSEAVEEANRLVRNAEKDAERIRLEAEDYAERHLTEAETVLGELLRYVQDARAELHQTRPAHARSARFRIGPSGLIHSRPPMNVFEINVADLRRSRATSAKSM